MKKLLLSLIFSVLFFGIGYSQDYNYRFKVEGVDTRGDAKYVTEVIRYDFEALPLFNDSSGYFEFMSPVLIEEADLVLLLANGGYTLSEYNLQVTYEGETEILEEK